MMADTGYQAVMARREQILRRSTGIDYVAISDGPLRFDYEMLMGATQYSLEDIRDIQQTNGIGGTPLVELRRVAELARAEAEPGMGARIFVKDEAANPSGSFKDRRASVSVHHARQLGYKGVVAATSGNFGAAVAAQAARHGLRAIIIQELFDSVGRGQPEILEKRRKCEVAGAEVIQCTVGPELFYVLLLTLEETGYFNASLYTPFSVKGIETLGWEVGRETKDRTGRWPSLVLATHAGGGMVTGVARGLRAVGASESAVIGVSVDLRGLHMASDTDFNRKSFTTGHTGFSMPFTVWPDRVDVPRNAARPLRYIDRLVTVTQGEVFYVTELAARLEGLERGPAGNTSLAAALALAPTLPENEVIVVTETEYTGAGKSTVPQLCFSQGMGIEVRRGLRTEDVPGRRIVLPDEVRKLGFTEIDLDDLRRTYVSRAEKQVGRELDERERVFVQEDLYARS